MGSRAQGWLSPHAVSSRRLQPTGSEACGRAVGRVRPMQPLPLCLPGASCSPVDVAPALSQAGLKLRQGMDGSNMKGGLPATLHLSSTPSWARDALQGTPGLDVGVPRTRRRRPVIQIHPTDNRAGSRAPSGGHFYIRGFLSLGLREHPSVRDGIWPRCLRQSSRTLAALGGSSWSCMALQPFTGDCICRGLG